MSKSGYSYIECRDSELAELSADAPRDNTTKILEDKTRESNEYPNSRNVSFANGAKALYIPSSREQDRGDYDIQSF